MATERQRALVPFSSDRGENSPRHIWNGWGLFPLNYRVWQLGITTMLKLRNKGLTQPPETSYYPFITPLGNTVDQYIIPVLVHTHGFVSRNSDALRVHHASRSGAHPGEQPLPSSTTRKVLARQTHPIQCHEILLSLSLSMGVPGDHFQSPKGIGYR